MKDFYSLPPEQQAQDLVALIPFGTHWIELSPRFPRMFISETGHVASARSGHVRVLKCGLIGNYRSLSIRNGARAYVHQVVCETFHGPRPAGHEVRHLDGDKLHNDIDNVVWGTRKENAADRVRHGTSNRGERHGMARLTRQIVNEMRALRASTGLTYRLIAKRYGVPMRTAYSAIRGLSWK